MKQAFKAGRDILAIAGLMLALAAVFGHTRLWDMLLTSLALVKIIGALATVVFFVWVGILAVKKRG